MRQALHILRKDVWRFRAELCILAALVAVFTFSQVYDSGALYPYLRWDQFILPLAWWMIICLLIHEESLIGDRLFWITRPYSRGSLLTAKVLFVLLFVNTPMLLAGFVILAVSGFQPLSYLPHFLWMQVGLVAIYVLLPLALASLTRTLVQFTIGLLGAIASFFLLSSALNLAGQPRSMAWTHGTLNNLLVSTPVLVVLLLQWSTRKRLVAIGTGVALAVLVLFTFSEGTGLVATTVQSHRLGERGAAATAVTLNADRVFMDSQRDSPGGTALAVPVQITNLPAGQMAAPESIEMTFEGQGGARWSTGWMHPYSSDGVWVFQKDPAPDRTYEWPQHVVMDGGFYLRVRSTPVTIRGSVYVIVNARRGVDLVEKGTTAVPGGGLCEVYRLKRGSVVGCRAPFEPPFNMTDSFGVPPQETVRLLSSPDLPIPGDSDLSPLVMADSGGSVPKAEYIFMRYEPRAYVRRWFTVGNVRLP